MAEPFVEEPVGEARRAPSVLSKSDTLLGRGENPPIVGRLRRNVVVALDPVDDQVADFRTGAINDRRIFIHRVTAAAIEPVMVDGDPQLPIRIERLPLVT